MQTISYRRPKAIEAVNPDGQVADIERHHQLLTEAGFTAAHQWERQGGTKLDTATTLYPEMAGKTLKLWRQFLPTVVSPAAHRFDTPPVEALEAIKSARDVGCFDSIEVWTPEGNSFLGLVARKTLVAKEKLRQLGDRLDPMAVGVVTDRSGVQHYFQIARWGEALKDLKQIKRQVALLNTKARLAFVILPILALFTGFTAYYKGIERFGYGNMVPATLMGLCVAAMLGCVVTIIVVEVGEARAIRRSRKARQSRTY